MLDLTTCDPARLQLVGLVCSRLLDHAEHLQAEDLMLLGTQCRDVLHDALGHTFLLRATQDLDIAIAIADWKAYREIVGGLPAISGESVWNRPPCR